MLYAQQMPTPAQGQQLPELCAQNNGTWLEKYKEQQREYLRLSVNVASSRCQLLPVVRL